MRLIPSLGSGRYSPGPGMVSLLEERVYQELRTPVPFCSQAPPDNLAIDSKKVPNGLSVAIRPPRALRAPQIRGDDLRCQRSRPETLKGYFYSNLGGTLMTPIPRPFRSSR